ncbi:DUF1330 domain-containing protein [Haloterrigena sp. SYSU A558-1]|uniref:DUF1330 domain-containing protein n=1 Tax=Haloterrigena gelatinilytica TaxID=2741724 RepID=A0A8J8GJI3_9EURY|nr:DUF1330 domain-containing protein [Haloterrigena gelatinilytica]NUB90801.1 DUF1330 domain-containing protein [Haloterrigena gelatinilytica]NUC73380.1 DUF1330 domain-containing protein [Haloterrigena gelatinilytica]
MSNRTTSGESILRRTVLKASAVTMSALGLMTTASGREEENQTTEEEPRESAGPKGYFIGLNQVTDTDRFLNEYIPIASETVDEYGGETLVFSVDEVDVLEGEWEYNVTVVLEFPSVEEAQNWFTDETYQEAAEIAEESTEYRDLVVTSEFAE